jgi:hypothetical protein
MKKNYLLLGLVFITSFAFSEFEITVYNQNFAVVKEQRKINLSQGIQKIEITDVAAYIEPRSVHFKSLTAPDKCYVLEQNFEYDLINSNKLLQKYIGKEITLERKIDDKTEIIKGALLSVEGDKVLLKSNNEKILVHPSGEISLPSLREGLVLKPTLSWLIKNKQPGEHNIEIAYITDNLKWEADYVVVISNDDKYIDLTGWVTIDNKSGATFQDAKIKLVAGDVHRVIERPFIAEGVSYKQVLPKGAAQFEEKEFFEYHMYTLQRKTTIKNNETKQIEFISASNVPVKKNYTYDGTKIKTFSYYSPILNEKYGTESNKKVSITLEFKNSKENNLGIPLPKGKIRVYKEDTSDKSLIFVGEDLIDHTPKDENLEVYLGDAFDVIAERIQTDFKKTSDTSCKESFKIVLRNHKNEDVEIKVVEHLYRWSNWKIVDASDKYEKVDSQTIVFKVKVPKDSEKEITYTVYYWW